MSETVYNMSRALECVRIEETQAQGGVVGLFFFKERNRLEVGGLYLVRDGVCVSLERLKQVNERVEAGLPLETLFCEVLPGLRGAEKLESSAKRMRENLCGWRTCD